MVGKVGGGSDRGCPYAAPRVVVVAREPCEHVDVVGSVGLDEPRGSAWQDEVPHATFLKVAGPWQDFVADVVEVQLGGRQEVGAWERDTLPW